MIRDVDLVSYLPPFLTEFQEITAALEAINPEFTLVWEAKERVLYNEFIATADEYGISRFESLLKILPSKEDTLESRRARVQSKWFNELPYTLKVLIQKLVIHCGGNNFILNHNFSEGYTLALQTDLELYGQVEELQNLLTSLLPCTIVIVSQNIIPCSAKAGVYIAAGVCTAEEFQITNDYLFSTASTGKLNVGGASVGTVQVLITNDFKENYNVTGKEEISAGVAVSEIVTAQKGD